MAKSKTKPKAKLKTKLGAKAKRDPKAALIAAALSLAARKDWGRIAFGDIAAAARIEPDAARRLFRSREAVLAAFMREIDAKALAGHSEDAAGADSVRDRLFDLLMRRLDLLEPHRRAIGNIHAAYRRQPWTALCLMPQGKASMGETLRVAGNRSPFPLARLQAAALALAWAGVIIPAWIKDESPDLARTMATLDRLLKRTEPFLMAEGLSGLWARA